MLNRLERVGETMRAALNDLAVMAPEWLQALAPPEWYQRYGRRVENYHLPKTDAAREELARVIAADGERLLAAVDAATDQPVLAQLPAVLTLRRVWAEQYTGEPGQLRWREVKDMPSPAGIDQLALRHGGALQHQARDGMGGVQGAPDRDVR